MQFVDYTHEMCKDMQFVDYTHEMCKNSLRIAPWGLKPTGLFQYKYNAVNILSALIRLSCKTVNNSVPPEWELPHPLQRYPVFETCHFWNDRWGTIPETKQSYFYIFITQQNFVFLKQLSPETYQNAGSIAFITALHNLQTHCQILTYQR